MNTFKAFLKILSKNRFLVIMYIAILVILNVSIMSSKEANNDFVSIKPDIYIENEDEEKGITKDLIRYLNNNCNVVKLKDNENAISDALFYRDVNYIIYIPKNYNNDFLAGKNPELKIKTNGNYEASLTEMLLKKYIKVANAYNEYIEDENELITKINETLNKQSEVKLTSKVDNRILNRATVYYNFVSYSLLGSLIYIICVVLTSFKNQKIQKRIIISSTNYKKINRQLLASNILFALVVWAFFVVVSLVLIGDFMYTPQGLIYILNSFIFTICATSLAFLLGTVIKNRDAIDGVVNVVSLGSSFLCGVFAPIELIPDYVLKIAHVLPSYYYVRNNEAVKTLEVMNYESLKPILLNGIIILCFSLLFIILTNIISKKKQRIN